MGEPVTNGPKIQPRFGCFRTCLSLSIIGLVIVILASSALYIWLRGQGMDLNIVKGLIQSRQGGLSQEELMREMTKAMGTGQITILNFADEDAWVNITNTKQDGSGGSNTLFNDLRPFDMQSQAKLPGTYEAQFRLDFNGFGEKPPALAICTFILDRDDNYQFIVLNDRVLLALEKDESGSEIDVTRSTLCQKEGNES